LFKELVACGFFVCETFCMLNFLFVKLVDWLFSSWNYFFNGTCCELVFVCGTFCMLSFIYKNCIILIYFLVKLVHLIFLLVNRYSSWNFFMLIFAHRTRSVLILFRWTCSMLFFVKLMIFNFVKLVAYIDFSPIDADFVHGFLCMLILFLKPIAWFFSS